MTNLVRAAVSRVHPNSAHVFSNESLRSRRPNPERTGPVIWHDFVTVTKHARSTAKLCLSTVKLGLSMGLAWSEHGLGQDGTADTLLFRNSYEAHSKHIRVGS